MLRAGFVFVRVAAPGADAMTYVIFAMQAVLDQGSLQQYASRVTPIVEKFGGKYLARDTNVEVKEGSWPATATVILEFPSDEHARRWYASPEYQEILPLRLRGASGPLIVVHGVEAA